MSDTAFENLSALVLIGGRSSRMGRPKHLISFADGETWLERNVRILSPFVEQVCLSGRGEVPLGLQNLERIEDQKGCQGPMAGVMGAMEKYPDRDWLIMACDMPVVSKDAVSWLLAEYKGNKSNALVPENIITGRLEPLFAVYRSGAAEMFSRAAAAKKFAMTSIADYENIYSPKIPESLIVSWSNVNNEEQLHSLLGS